LVANDFWITEHVANDATSGNRPVWIVHWYDSRISAIALPFTGPTLLRPNDGFVAINSAPHLNGAKALLHIRYARVKDY
jgi:hypothetical protein